MDPDGMGRGGGRKRRNPTQGEHREEEEKSPARQRLSTAGHPPAAYPIAPPAMASATIQDYRESLAQQQLFQFARSPQAGPFNAHNPNASMRLGNFPLLESAALARMFQQNAGSVGTGGDVNPYIRGLPAPLPYSQQQFLFSQNALSQAAAGETQQRGMPPIGHRPGLGQPLPGLSSSLSPRAAESALPSASAVSSQQFSGQNINVSSTASGSADRRLLQQGMGLGYPPLAVPSQPPPRAEAAVPAAAAALPTGVQQSSEQDSSSSRAGDIGDEDAATLTNRPPVILYMPCDDAVISSYQCLARKQIELFEAQAIDVDAGAQGRNRGIVLGQVGIRCRHCAHLYPRHRTKSSTFYPSKLNRIYQTAQNLGNTHLTKTCQHIPQDTRNELLRLQQDKKTSAGGGKEYWSDGARILGVYETDTYLRFKQNNDYPGYMPPPS